MDRPATIIRIKALLYDPYINPDERELFLPQLEKMSDQELTDLEKNYQKKITAFTDLELTMQRVRQAGEATIDRQAVLAAAAKQHPLYDATPERVTALLKANTVSYIGRNIDLQKEYDVYQNSEAEFARKDDIDRPSGQGPADIREAFLEGLRSCTEPLPGDPLKKTAGNFLTEYEKATAEALVMSGAERQSYLQKNNVALSAKEVAAKLLTAFDHIRFSGDFLNTSDELEELMQAVSEGQLQPAMTSPATNSSPQPVVQKSVVVAKPVTPVVRPTEQQIKKVEAPSSPVLPLTRAVTPSIPISKVATPTAPVAPMSVPQKPSALLGAEVSALVQKWLAAKTDIVAISNELVRGLRGREATIFLSALRTFAERGALGEILKGDGRLNAVLEASYRRQDRLNDCESLRLSPTSPRHLKDFVKLALETQLRLSPNEAAHIAVDLVNIVNRSAAMRLQPWAYFDVQAGQYRWV